MLSIFIVLIINLIKNITNERLVNSCLNKNTFLHLFIKLYSSLKKQIK